MIPQIFSDISLEMWLVCMIVMLVLTIFVYAFYSGLFTSTPVSTSETVYGPLTMAYKTSVGPYKNVGEIFTESFCLLPEREQLGIYYDDPEGVQASQLRCAVGPVLAKGDAKPVPDEMEKMVKNGFKIIHLPKPSYVVTASFPFTTTLSIYLAMYKVYPKLRDYIALRNLCAYPAMEVYTDSNIIFMMPLSRQDEFYVSEFQEEEMSIATTDMESVSGLESPMMNDEAGFVVPRFPEERNTEEKNKKSLEGEVSSDDDSGDEHDEHSDGEVYSNEGDTTNTVEGIADGNIPRVS